MPRVTIEPIPLAGLPVHPKVSVAITCYNYGRFLAECLDSCLAQSVVPDQIVVVDDGSTDDSQAVLDRYAARFPNITAISQHNGGMGAATNRALAACSGDVVLLLDADDVMAPDRIESVLSALRTPLEGHLPGWVHHHLVRFSADGNAGGLAPYYGATAPNGSLADETLKQVESPVQTPTSGLAFRRELLTAIGPLDEHRVPSQDLMLRTAASLLSPVVWLTEPLSRYRVHEAADSAGGLMASLEKVSLTRERIERLDAWTRGVLERNRPGTGSLWPSLADQSFYLWLQYLERWWSGLGKDFSLLSRVLRHRNAVHMSLQQRIYHYGGAILPMRMFMTYSRLIFGTSPAKTFLRMCLGRA